MLTYSPNGYSRIELAMLRLSGPQVDAIDALGDVVEIALPPAFSGGETVHVAKRPSEDGFSECYSILVAGDRIYRGASRYMGAVESLSRDVRSAA